MCNHINNTLWKHYQHLAQRIVTNVSALHNRPGELVVSKHLFHMFMENFTVYIQFEAWLLLGFQP